ncbi:unnamed protein product [Malus baccata var. baccata]
MKKVGNDSFSNNHPHTLPYLPLVSHPHTNLWIPKVETPRNTALWAYDTTNHCNLHMLGNFPYCNFQYLAEKYGPIIGFIPQSCRSLFLKTHDRVFANRPKLEVCDYLSYRQKGMALTDYGPYWRQYFSPLRREEVGLLVQSLKKAVNVGEVVDMSNKVGGLVESIIYMMILGSKKDDLFDVKGIVEEIMSLIGSFHIGDYRLTKRAKRTRATADQLFEKIIGEHGRAALTNESTIKP